MKFIGLHPIFRLGRPNLQTEMESTLHCGKILQCHHKYIVRTTTTSPEDRGSLLDDCTPGKRKYLTVQGPLHAGFELILIPRVLPNAIKILIRVEVWRVRWGLDGRVGRS